MELSENQKIMINRHVEAFLDKPGALLPLMHAIQDDLGFVPERIHILLFRKHIIYRLPRFMVL